MAISRSGGSAPDGDSRSRRHRASVLAVAGHILVICLALMTACYSPAEPDCGFACREGSCPGNYFCAPDRFCHKNGTSPTASCGFDARVDSPRPIDAPRPDSDTIPPELTSSMPANAETNVPTTGVIHVFFSEAVNGVDTVSFVVSSTVNIPGTIQSQDPAHWVFTPTSLLPAVSQITVTLTPQIVDYAGNALSQTVFTFQTGT